MAGGPEYFNKGTESINMKFTSKVENGPQTKLDNLLSVKNHKIIKYIAEDIELLDMLEGYEKGKPIRTVIKISMVRIND